MSCVDIAAVPYDKYLEEEYPIDVDYTLRLRSGQTILSTELLVFNAEHIDVALSIVSNITTLNPIVTLDLKQNGGVKGQVYEMRLTVVTALDRITQVIMLTIK